MKIVWIIGGPGSGKGTQSDKIVQNYRLLHISSGDLLRDEVKSGSEDGKRLQAIMAEGKLVSTEEVLNLIKKKMDASMYDGNVKGFLIDGYPRELEQGKLFEKTIGCVDLIIYFEVDDKIMIERLIQRGKDSGRADDNEETIKQRLNVFHENNGKILDHYSPKVIKISAAGTIDGIFEKVRASLDKLGDEIKKN